jgi:hypothetical protein
MHRISEKTPAAKQRHFRLRHDINETGVSCNRKSLSLPDDLLGPESRSGSWVAEAKVGEIRKIGLDVVVAKVEGNPAHCEIISAVKSLDDELVRDDLAKLFVRCKIVSDGD